MLKNFLKFVSLIGVATLIAAGTSYAGGLTFKTNGSVTYKTNGSSTFSLPGTSFGFSTHPTIVSACTGTRNAKTYGDMARLGSTWQRTDFYWKDIQPSGSTDQVFTNYDCLVNDAVAAGINTVALLKTNAPAWAAWPGCNASTLNCAPDNSTDFAQFCTKFATHYSGKINYFEIGNEQNSNGNWAPSATSSDYVLVLNACGSAIKAVIPNATIITGGLNFTGTISVPQTISDYLADGAQFDMIGLHPYTYNVDVNDPTFGWTAKVFPVRAQLNAAGDSAKQIAITEYGAPTDGPTLNPGRAGQKAEANALVATTSTMLGSGTYLNIWKIFWYTLYDANSNDLSTDENVFGVYTSFDNAKPAWATLRSAK